MPNDIEGDKPMRRVKIKALTIVMPKNIISNKRYNRHRIMVINFMFYKLFFI